MFKKVLSFIIAGAMCLGMCTAVGATNSFKETKSLYICSKSIPQSAVDYARDMFSHFYVSEMENIGYTSSQAAALKLGKGFVVDNYDLANMLEAYYFPVLLNNNISDILIVFKVNGEYGFQLGNKDLASAINNLSTSTNAPVRIVASDVAYYAVSSDNVLVLDTSNFESQSQVQNDVDTQITSLRSQRNISTSSRANIVTINSSTVYTENVQATTRAQVGIIRSVPQCNNIIYDNAAYPQVCWAACGGSMIEYYQNGSAATQSGADNHRLYIAAKNSYEPANVDDARTYIQERMEDIGLNYTLSVQYNKLAWNDVKTQINNNNAPFYTEWRRPGHSHAMVIKGYTYDNTAPTNSNYYRIYIMDPNSMVTVCDYNNGVNIFGTGVYTWTNTIVRD